MEDIKVMLYMWLGLWLFARVRVKEERERGGGGGCRQRDDRQNFKIGGFDSCEGVDLMNHLVMSPPGQSVACSLFNVTQLA